MAGSVAKRKEYDRLNDEISDLNAEVARLHKLIAVHCPEALEGKPVEIKKYSPDLCDRIYAMGRNGLSEDEWIAALGLTFETWDEWVMQHPELQKAAQQSHVAMRAYWSDKQREGMEKNNTRFPIQIYNSKMALKLRQQGSGKGDASKLVLLDLREPCGKCGHVAQ